MFVHRQPALRDLDHLIEQRRWILSLQQSAAGAVGNRVVLHHFVKVLHLQQRRSSAGMAFLSGPAFGHCLCDALAD